MSAPHPMRSLVLRARARRNRDRPRTEDEYNAKLAAMAAAGGHRDAAGALWNEMGELVLAYLVGEGLQPTDRLLDIGCGPLRIGLHLVDYLDAGNYFGIDAVGDLIVAGYDVELTAAGLQSKLPRSHLVADDDFGFATLLAGRTVDVALAQSVFTHLPPRHLQRCLEHLAPVITIGGTLHATFFVVSAREAAKAVVHRPGDVVTYRHENPYHYTWDDIVAASEGGPWSLDGPIDIGHPRAQVMVRFTRQLEAPVDDRRSDANGRSLTDPAR